MDPHEGVDKAFVEKVFESVVDNYTIEASRIYQELAIATTLEISFKNRAILMGLAPKTEEFDKAIDRMKSDFLDNWRRSISEIHKSQGKTITVSTEGGSSVFAEEIGVDIDEAFEKAIAEVEIGLRTNLAMPPRIEDLSTMFDFGDLDMKGPPL